MLQNLAVENIRKLAMGSEKTKLGTFWLIDIKTSS